MASQKYSFIGTVENIRWHAKAGGSCVTFRLKREGNSTLSCRVNDDDTESVLDAIAAAAGKPVRLLGTFQEERFTATTGLVVTFSRFVVSEPLPMKPKPVARQMEMAF